MNCSIIESLEDYHEVHKENVIDIKRYKGYNKVYVWNDFSLSPFPYNGI